MSSVSRSKYSPTGFEKSKSPDPPPHLRYLLPLVIARSVATRQSSGSIGQPTHRPGISHRPAPLTPCHREEGHRPDAAIQRPLSAYHRIVPVSRITPQTGLPRPEGLAMTESGGGVPPLMCPNSHQSSPHTLSLRGGASSRRGNPSNRLGNTPNITPHPFSSLSLRGA